MLQRAGNCAGILHDPKVVFLDEPMSGLDPMGRREVRNLIEELKGEGKTVFFSTHILSDAEALCDRVAIIHLGKLRGVGAVEELTAGVGAQVEVVWAGTVNADLAEVAQRRVPRGWRYRSSRVPSGQARCRARRSQARTIAVDLCDTGENVAGRLFFDTAGERRSAAAAHATFRGSRRGQPPEDRRGRRFVYGRR
jgi:ABC-type multidrug transport system ATPase subunit